MEGCLGYGHGQFMGTLELKNATANCMIILGCEL